MATGIQGVMVNYGRSSRFVHAIAGRFSVAFVISWCFVFPTHVLGNGPEVGVHGGAVFPLDTESVQLLYESVTVRLPDVGPDGRDGHCECRYTLRNLLDGTQTFQMAFVTVTPGGFDEEDQDLYRTANFRVSIDRRELVHQMIPVAPEAWAGLVSAAPDSLPVWSMLIAPLDTVFLKMTHDIKWSGGGEGGYWGVEMSYQASPGRLWAGAIEKAEIYFQFPGFLGEMLRCVPQDTECYSIRLSPPGYVYSEGGVRWTFEHWEPTESFSVGLGFSDSPSE